MVCEVMTYQFACPRDGCRFELRCEGDDEVRQLARAHARVAHHGRFAPVDLDRQVRRIESV